MFGHESCHSPLTSHPPSRHCHLQVQQVTWTCPFGARTPGGLSGGHGHGPHPTLTFGYFITCPFGQCSGVAIARP